MVDVPAICSTCGNVFFAPNLIGGSGKVIFQNSRLGPCPVCGGTGDIIDGVYDAATNTAKLIVTSVKNVHQLNKFKEILLGAQKNKLSSKQINSQVKKEIPELQSLSDWLPKTRIDLYSFIGIILTLITLLSSTAIDFFNAKENISEEQVKELIKKSIQKQKPIHKSPPITKKNKVGRNQPCPCGSGKKYKKCCLITI